MSRTDDKQFLKRLLDTFKAEAHEHIASIAQKLSELEHAGDAARAAIVEVAFREAHSLKAAARAVNRPEIERLCQAIEGLFAAFKRGEAQLSRTLLDALHRANDGLADLLASEDAGRAVEPARIDGLLRALETARESESPQPAAQAQARVSAAPEAPTADTIRLPVQRLDALLLQVEDLLAVKLGAQEQATALNAPLAGFAEWKREWDRVRGSLRESQVGGDAQTLLEFLDWSESRIGALESAVGGVAKSAIVGARTTTARVDRLRHDIKQMLMLQSRTLLETFPRTVRDLARDQAKEVELITEGGELEIDRRILEEVREPLLHLVRNAVDHGIEMPAERQRKGKAARATLRLAVTPRDSDKVEFAVADDGGGVRLERVAAAAVKSGLLPAQRAEAAGEAELLPMIFHSGVSTSPMITELSGRGLGLAIVRERVERLGGSVSVETREGGGTTFRLVVPVTLATFRGIQVSAAEQMFIIPTLGVERVLRARRDALRTIENGPAMAIGGSHVPLVNLAHVLELPAVATPPGDRDQVVALVLGTAARRVAFEVDEVLGDEEVLVKPLGRCLQRVRNVAGATVLGDGRIAPILNVHDLLKSAVASKHGTPPAAALGPGAEAQRQIRVLVVEDSITARGLLKNILEAAGYRVKTAVDGADGWAALKLEPFDLVVSDVEMPRMNGFDLTARIRADKQLADLPVVLVTALESRADRERGVDVGANAYIAKGDFDQGLLLEVLRRLA